MNDKIIKDILDLLKEINSTIEFDSLFLKIINSIRDFLNVERCSLFLVDYSEKVLWSKIAHDLEIEKIVIPLNQGLVGACFTEGKIILVEDAYKDKRFCNEVDRKTGFKTKTVLCYPLRNLEGKIIGILQLINKKDGLFNNQDIELLEILSQHLVIALNNSIYFKEALEKRELETELSIAKKIQEKFLPHYIPEIKNLKLSCKNIQFDFVGGDYYDVLKLDDLKTLLLIADVSGHGIPSALLMTNIQAAIRLQDYSQNKLDDIFKRLNDFVCNTVEMEKFITAFAGIFNSKTKEFEYINAGHLPPFIFRNGEFIDLDATGIPIGMFEGQKYAIRKIQLLPDDLLVLFTDGIVEATKKREMFGIERLKEIVLKNYNNSPDVIIGKILESFHKFLDTLQDDITLLIAKVF